MTDIGIKNQINNCKEELKEKYNLKMLEVNGIHFKICKDYHSDALFITEKIADVVIFIKGLEVYQNHCL